MGGSVSNSYKFVSAADPNKASVAAVVTPDWIATGGNTRLQMKSESYENIAPIGKGKFGLVHLAKTIPSNKYVAVKYIPKQMIFDCEASDRIQNELDILMRVKHPFIMQAFGVFDTNTCLAIVCEYCAGGELYHLLKKRIKLKEEESKFYLCELVCVLKYLHEEKNIVYRDLKPENILIDAQGHIKLCDFGFATYFRNGSDDAEAEGLRDGCGTAMYIAPEIASGFKKHPHGFAVDWWALGCILFEMVTGNAPFGDSDHMSKFEIFNNITEKNPSIPFLVNVNIRNLIKGLLDKNAPTRYSAKEITSNAWMQGVDWTNVQQRMVRPPWIPTCTSVGSTENFIKWDNVLLPQTNPAPHVVGYCNAIVIPKPKTSVEDPSVPVSTIPGLPRRASASQLSSSTKQGSSRMYPSDKSSKAKIEKSPSVLDSQQSSPGDNKVPPNNSIVRSPSHKSNKHLVSSPVLSSAVSSKKIVPRS